MKKNILALDLGGSKFIVGIVNEAGEILAKERYEWTELTAEGMMQDILAAVKSFRQSHVDHCDAAGVTIPGLADPEQGIWIEASFSGIRQLPIADLLEKEWNLSVYIDNDVNACAMAEKKFGCCKDVENFVWITVSNGIGGALYLNDDIFYGAFGNAGEIGHLIVEEAGRKCNCGSTGCLEMHAAGPAVSRNYALLANESEADVPDAKRIAELARSGDEIALRTWELEGKYLGKASAALANMINPARIVFGGGVMESFDLILPALLENYKANVYEYANQNLEIVHTELGYYAALLGAAAVAFRRLSRR